MSSADETTCPSTVHVQAALASLLPRIFRMRALMMTWSPGRTGLRYLTLSALRKNAVRPSFPERRNMTIPAACATTSSSLSKPGFYTEVKDGRLWVFLDGSKDLAEFKQHGEPAKQVTRIGGGPNGMTIKSSDAKVIDEYMAAK